MKKIIGLMSMMLLPMLFAFTDNSSNEITVQKVSLQVLSANELDDSTIDLYTDNGWTFNSDTNQLQREVVYSDEVIEINGDTYDTDENGKISYQLDKKEETQIEISSTSLTNNDEENEQIIDTSTIDSGEVIVLQETINLDDVIDSMNDADLEAAEISAENEKDGITQVGGLTDGQLPKKGAYVHCNRFNGYKGDGRYYSKTKHPVASVVNFFQSDCDVALAKSTKCLADYGSNPYCSTKSTSTAGKCSPNIVSHSRLYHKHTGWFSPSK